MEVVTSQALFFWRLHAQEPLNLGLALYSLSFPFKVFFFFLIPSFRWKLVFLSLVPYLEMLNHPWNLPTPHQNRVNALSHLSERFIVLNARGVGPDAHRDGLFELVFQMGLRSKMIYRRCPPAGLILIDCSWLVGS